MKKNENEVKKNTKKREKYIAEKSDSDKNKEHKGIFQSISKYFRGVSTETKRIKWTTLNDLIKYSIASVAFVVFFGVYFYAIDWIALLVRSLAN